MSRIPPQGARIVGAWPPPPHRQRAKLSRARDATEPSRPARLRSRAAAELARALRVVRKGRPRTA